MGNIDKILTANTNKVFEVTADSDDINDWILKPLSYEKSVPELDDTFLIVQAINPQDKTSNKYFLDFSLPEIINDHVYIVKDNRLVQKDSYEIEGVIPNVAFEGFGNYELYYSKDNPQVGIDILKEGLKTAKNKTFIYATLGYIYRDEDKKDKAIDAFTQALNLDSSLDFIKEELEQLKNN